MREIKFRVYDTIDKKFLYCGDDFVVYEGTPRENEYGDMISVTYWRGLEQYTGLKDKNGVEIYEGDIVSLVLSETHKYKGRVYFDDYGYHLEGDSPFRFFHKSNQNEMEVIGNIHEQDNIK